MSSKGEEENKPQLIIWLSPMENEDTRLSKLGNVSSVQNGEP
jgi:hypothetical protein